MATTSLPTALRTIQETLEFSGVSFDASLVMDMEAASTGLFEGLTEYLARVPDPRTALILASLAENQYRAALRAQLLAVKALEASGAHRLSITEYDAVRAGRTDTSISPDYVSGRAHYKDTTNLLETWLGINHWEAKARVEDAHRVVGRRTMAGTDAPPRYELLAELFADPARDPRTARDAARRIDKFEPTDTIGEGQPLRPDAQAPDGVLLEEHAAKILRENERVTAKARLDDLCTAYKKENCPASKPEIGIFKRSTIQGVDRYAVNVEGIEAELWRSTMSQSDNPRTLAGIAARFAQAGADRTQDSPIGDPGSVRGAVEVSEALPEPSDTEAPTDPIGEWMTTTDPAPQWAVDPDLDSSVGDEKPDQLESSRNTADEQASQPSEPARDEEVSPPLRRLRAINNLLLQRATGTGSSDTIVPSLIVTMTLKDLMYLAKAHGITAHGVQLEAGELRQLLVKAKILPHVLGGQSQILDAGRSRRFHSGPMRTALYVRDRGCIMPGCTYPPELCEANHWPPGGWAGGCGTSVDEGSLFCPREHADYHAGNFKIVLHNGLPHVLLPPHIDPTQTPQRNKYWFPNTYEDSEDESADPPNLG